MPPYSITFLSRYDASGWTNTTPSQNVPLATDAREAFSWVRHGARHGEWAIEGPITVRGPLGRDGCETYREPA
jgi:hypothetical protein